MQGIQIESVTPGSPAARAGLLPGERLLAINGTRLRDLIDYSWMAHEDEQELTVSSRTGSIRTVLLEPEPDETPGLIFTAPEPKRCGNNCIFCFVHQLPKGLRRPLYVKDEDYRLSFLQGNYVTLSNLKPSELRRIKAQRLSPLYISVHAVASAVRERLLGKTGIPPILEQLKELAQARIVLHTQVVLCPGINDGEILEQTVAELAALYPSVRSLAVVPVGLTEHRQRLPNLIPVDTDYATAFLDSWLPLMRAVNKRLGDAFLQLADEFFLKAGYPVPPLKEYGDLPQWENGVGMVAWFQKDAAAVLKRAKPLRPVRVTVVTGESPLGFVEEFLQQLSEKTGGTLTAIAIPNRLFGSSVTVTGLISGSDIVAELRGKDLGETETLLIPEVMLKEGEGCFLDNLTPNDLSRELGLPVVSFESTPGSLYHVLRKLTAKKQPV
jgi:putative radical SAM enzyme (TIGR03279 family)